MGPGFTLHVECDMPGLNGMGGFSTDREIEASELAIVTGREEIFSEPYFEVGTVVRADGFIRDAQDREAGVFVRVLFRDEEKERYELSIPIFIMKVFSASPSRGRTGPPRYASRSFSALRSRSSQCQALTGEETRSAAS